MKQLLRPMLALLPKLGKPKALIPVLVALVLVAALVLLRPILPPWAFLLCLAVFGMGGLAWAAVKGLPWYRQRRFLRAHDGVVAGGEGEPARALERRLDAARDTILHSPTLSAGRDPLYRLPWYLVLAADDEGAQSLLRPPLADSPFPEPDATEPLVWSWWFYNGLIAIQLPARFVCEPQQTEVRGVWYHALRLLDRHRPKQPANGIVVVLRASLLTGPVDALRETCTRIRRLIDEALRLLQIEAPVYLVVAGCEAVPGFDAFARALPEEVRRHALGHRFAERGGGSLKAWLESGFEELRRTLHAIRLGLLRESTDARSRRGVFGVVEGFGQLKEGLAQAGAILFEHNPYQRRPWLAGVYFTGGDAFARDLFSRFLPADQPLAHKRRRARILSWGVAMTGALLLLAASAVTALWILTTSRDLERLIAAAEQACAVTPEPAQAVAALAACRDAIAALEGARPGFHFDPGLGRAAHAEEALERNYVAAYGAAVLAPFDRAVDAALQRRQLRFADHLALARRFALLRECLDGSACAASDAAPAFEATLLAGVPALAAPEARALAPDLHRASLGWADPATLGSRRDLLAARLETAFQVQPPTVPDIVAWAAERARPIELAGFWQRAPPAGPRVEVPAAFTRARFEAGPARLAADLSGASVAPVADALRREALGAYALAWQQFLASFEAGALAWSADVAGLIALLGGEGSPYPALFRTLEEELFPLQDEAGVPPWPKALQATLAGPWLEAEPKLRTLFFELSEDREGGRAYQLAAAIYGAGTAPDPTVALFREVQAALESPPAEGEPLSLEGQRAWRVVRQPLALWLRIVNHRAGGHLDRLWRQQVVEPAQAQPERAREAFLFGPQGRVAAFRESWLKPLLAGGGAGALGEAPPVADEFQAFLEGASGGPPSGPIYAGTLAIAGPAQFGPVPGEPGSIAFTLSCLSSTQSASDASPQQAVLTLAWSPDNCFDVRITLTLPSLLKADPAAPALVLARTYPGPTGFLDFIAEFRDGPRAFAPGAFTASPEARAALASAGIARVTVPIQLKLSDAMLAWLERPAEVALPARVSASAFQPSSGTQRLQ